MSGQDVILALANYYSVPFDVMDIALEEAVKKVAARKP